jgi:hypothetical protein
MIEEVAQTLKASLRPDDLALLQSVLIKVCSAGGKEITSLEAEKHAQNMLMLYQSGIRNRHQLFAMLTGRKFP